MKRLSVSFDDFVFERLRARARFRGNTASQELREAIDRLLAAEIEESARTIDREGNA